MIIQQIYWQSVWGDAVKKSKGRESYRSHTKEEELTYQKLIKRQREKPQGRT